MSGTSGRRAERIGERVRPIGARRITLYAVRVVYIGSLGAIAAAELTVPLVGWFPDVAPAVHRPHEVAIAAILVGVGPVATAELAECETEPSVPNPSLSDRGGAE